MTNTPVARTDDTCTLDSLVGEHVLSGVDFGTAEKGEYDYEAPATCVFVLDGVTYTVTEDPSDGYRSHMRDIVKGGPEVSNRFPECRVLCSMRTKGEYSQVDDILEMRDMATGKLVLEIGTTNTDDYYPSYRANFDPSAMEINSGTPQPSSNQWDYEAELRSMCKCEFVQPPCFYCACAHEMGFRRQEIQRLRKEREAKPNTLETPALPMLEFNEHCACCTRNKITVEVFGQPDLCLSSSVPANTSSVTNKTELAHAPETAKKQSTLPEYTALIGDAGSVYLKSVSLDGHYQLSGTFRWHELWDTMCRAAQETPATTALQPAVRNSIAPNKQCLKCRRFFWLDKFDGHDCDSVNNRTSVQEAYCMVEQLLSPSNEEILPARLAERIYNMACTIVSAWNGGEEIPYELKQALSQWIVDVKTPTWIARPVPKTGEPLINTLVRGYIKDGVLKLPPEKMREILNLIGPPVSRRGNVSD